MDGLGVGNWDVARQRKLAGGCRLGCFRASGVEWGLSTGMWLAKWMCLALATGMCLGKGCGVRVVYCDAAKRRKVGLATEMCQG